ncbi:MAG: hypothetical protein GH155_00095 [Spirochaeta sp.]|nr:hypothetical protein [Spirochaeta sp.]
MSEKKEFLLKTEPADFAVLLSGIFTIAREMGVNMERTARAPIYYSAHDFTNAILDLNCEIVALAEYIPVLNGATPFATRAVRDYFKGDVNEGDVFLVNDPYTLDAGNQMADWTIVYPVFVDGEHMFWVANKAHQQDTGGGGFPEATTLLLSMCMPKVSGFPRSEFFPRGKKSKTYSVWL